MGAFMAVHKQKREEAVRQSEKIIAENRKISEKVKESLGILLWHFSRTADLGKFWKSVKLK